MCKAASDALHRGCFKSTWRKQMYFRERWVMGFVHCFVAQAKSSRLGSLATSENLCRNNKRRGRLTSFPPSQDIGMDLIFKASC